MKRLFLFLFLSCQTVFGQKIHLPHEVEKAAEPAGGLTYLTQFIASNVQLPFKSSINGMNGRVYVKGVVEPDGSMSDIAISKGLDSLTNKEAMRVMSLFKAWKPALVKGEKVRQSIVYPVTFKTLPRTNFDSTSHALAEYFDSQYRPETNPKKYEYKSITPVDDQGYINKDLVYAQLKGGKWKEVARIPF